MLLKVFHNFMELYRDGKAIICKLIVPHRVISTCRINGGIREDIEYVVNHQACEPKDESMHKKISTMDPMEYHKSICNNYNIPPDKTVLLGTAANMYLAGFSEKSFRDLSVFTVSTAGVETNAGRAGDPSQVYESNGSYETLKGTINIMVFINKELIPGAMVRAVKMATEAKTSILQELNVPSRYSSGIATGTGTDQIAISCPILDEKPLTSAGKHSKLGELIALSVREAVKSSLSLQNKLTPEERRYLPRLLERFGFDEEKIFDFFKNKVDGSFYTFLRNNKYPLFSDSLLISHALSYLHLLDQIHWGIIPENCAFEVLTSQAALIASSISLKFDLFKNFREELSKGFDKDNYDPISILLSSVLLGIEKKWSD